MQTKLDAIRLTLGAVLGLFYGWCADMIGLAWPISVVIGLVVAGLIVSLLRIVAVGREPERWEDLV